MLESYSRLGEEGFGAGLELISQYRFHIRDRADEDVLTDLAVDRTRIMRGTGHTDMKPPYEGLYKKGRAFEHSVLGVKRFYRKAALLPDETNKDSVDYLCVELDFMRQLCLREENLRLKNAAGETIASVLALEEEFLRVHLGSWISEFCSAVKKHASTDFFRGFALILNAYIRTEKKWLESVVRRA